MPLFLARTERNPISPLPGMEVRPQNTWEGETSSLPQFAVNVTTTGIGDRLFTIRQEQSKLFQTVMVLQEVPDLRRQGKHSHKDKKMGAPLLSAGLTFYFSLSTWSRRYSHLSAQRSFPGSTELPALQGAEFPDSRELGSAETGTVILPFPWQQLGR